MSQHWIRSIVHGAGSMIRVDRFTCTMRMRTGPCSLCHTECKTHFLLQRNIHVILRHNIKHCKTVRAPSQTPPRPMSVSLHIWFTLRIGQLGHRLLVRSTFITYRTPPPFSRPGYGLGRNRLKIIGR